MRADFIYQVKLNVKFAVGEAQKSVHAMELQNGSEMGGTWYL